MDQFKSFYRKCMAEVPMLKNEQLPPELPKAHLNTIKNLFCITMPLFFDRQNKKYLDRSRVMKLFHQICFRFLGLLSIVLIDFLSFFRTFYKVKRFFLTIIIRMPPVLSRSHLCWCFFFVHGLVSLNQSPDDFLYVFFVDIT